MRSSHIHRPASATERQGLSSAWVPYLDKLLEVRGLVRLLLDQGSPIELTAAEADVRLHVGQLRGQDVADHLHGHLLPRHLLADPQRSAGGTREVSPCLHTSQRDGARFSVVQTRMCVRGTNPGPLKDLLGDTRDRKVTRLVLQRGYRWDTFLRHTGCLRVLGNHDLSRKSLLNKSA